MTRPDSKLEKAIHAAGVILVRRSQNPHGLGVTRTAEAKTGAAPRGAMAFAQPREAA